MARQCVIDASATLGLFLRLPYAHSVETWMRQRYEERAQLVVPTLWEYECITGIRKAVSLKILSSSEAERLADRLIALDFQRVPPSLDLHRAALSWAEQIGQSKVYDAAYLALAESISAEFWTADQKLVHTMQGLGHTWVHAIQAN